MAPFNAWPILFLTFPTLVWLIDGAAVGRWGGVMVAAVTGWWFGFGYFVAGLYWMGYAFLVDAPTFGWLMPFAVIGLPAVLAIYTGDRRRARPPVVDARRDPHPRLGVALTATEWLRGHLFTGFPWNTFGYALTAPLPLAQSASVVGIWGLTFIAIASARRPPRSSTTVPKPAGRGCRFALGVAVLAGLGGWGACGFHRTPTRLVDKVHLRIMQPNLQQDVRFNYAARQEVMKRYIALSNRASGPHSPGMSDVTHLIWPESPFPFILDPRTRRARADRQAVVAERRADHRRDAACRTLQSRRSPRLQFDLRDRSRRRHSLASTTRFISFRSASICRLNTCSNAWACRS